MNRHHAADQDLKSLYYPDTLPHIWGSPSHLIPSVSHFGSQVSVNLSLFLVYWFQSSCSHTKCSIWFCLFPNTSMVPLLHLSTQSQWIKEELKNRHFERSVCLEFYVPSTHKFSRVTAGYSVHLLMCIKILENTVDSILPSTTPDKILPPNNEILCKKNIMQVILIFSLLGILRPTYARAILPPGPFLHWFSLAESLLDKKQAFWCSDLVRFLFMVDCKYKSYMFLNH